MVRPRKTWATHYEIETFATFEVRVKESKGELPWLSQLFGIPHPGCAPLTS